MIVLPVQLDSVRDLKDRSCKMSFITRELSNPEYAKFRDQRGLEGRIAFDLKEYTPDEYEEELDKVDEDLGRKSPSQRLRGAIFVYWKQNNISDNFKEFYLAQMEKIISKITKTLP